jgi:5-methylcytosine-specific restriction endonuclease McrA
MTDRPHWKRDRAKYASYARFYNSARWQRLRREHRKRNPLCAACVRKGLVVPAECVHHVRQHNGSERWFFDPANLESLCLRCHDGDATPGERDFREFSPEVDPETG